MPNSHDRLSNRAGYLILSNSLNIIFGFLGTIIIARLLSKHDLGTYKQALLVFAMIAPIFSLGIPASLLYFVPKLDQLKKKQFISQTFLALQFLSLLFCLAILSSSGLIADYFSNPSLKYLLIICSFFALFSLPPSAFTFVLISMERFRFASMVAAIFAFTSALAFIIPIVLGYPLPIVFAVMTAVVFIQLVYSFVHARRLVGKFSFKIEWNSLREQLRYAVPLGYAGVVSSLAWNTDRIMVSLFFKPAMYAIYVIGAVEVPLVHIVNAAVNNVLVPQFSILYKEQKLEKILEIWHEAIRKTSLIVLPAFAFLMLFSYQLVTLLFTTRYSGSVPIFRIYLCILPLRVATYSLILQSTGHTRDIMRGTTFYIILNAILNYALIKTMGLPGPAISTIVATFLLALFYLLKVKKVIKVGWKEIFPWKKVEVVLLVSGLTTLLVAPILLLNLQELFLAVGGGILFIILFVAIASTTGILTKEDKDLAKNWILLKPILKANE